MSVVEKFNNTRENIILENLPLVQKVADQICKTYSGIYEREDIVNIGVIGLIDAIEKYDPSRQAAFETYARWRIRGAIIDELRASGKISRSKMDKVNRLYGAIEEMQQKLHRRPTDDELSEYLQISHVQLNELYSAIHFLSSFSLESTVFSNSDKEINLLDMIEDKHIDKPDEVLISSEQHQILRKAIEQLKEREQVILNLIYYEDLAVKEIAELLDVSSSRISQIHGKILTKIRHHVLTAMERKV